MQSYGKPSGEYSMVEIKSKMIDYCLNTLRKRTVDEKLGEFSEIMKSSLVLKIAYDKSGLEVTYSVGSQSASVKGVDESTCVRQCKRKLLYKLLAFCMYTESTAQASSVLKSRYKKTDNYSSSTRDIYSEIELCRGRGTENDAKKAFGQIVLVDSEMDIPRELCDYVDGNKSPLILTINYLPTDWEITYEIGAHNASTSGAMKSTCMHQCKKHLLHELGAMVKRAGIVFDGGDNVVGRHESEVRSADTSQIVFLENDNSLQGVKLRALGDDEKSHGNTSSGSVSTVEPAEASGPSMGSTDESNTVVRNESIGDAKRCAPDNKTNGRAAAESAAAVAQIPEITSRRTDVSAASPAGARPSEQPRRSSNTLEAHEKYVNQVTVVLRNVTRDTIWHSSKRFIDILAQSSRANRLYLKGITDCIVAHAIDMPDNCAVYAELCCHAIRKAWVDSRAFQLDLVQSCRDELRKSGVLPMVETPWQHRNARQSGRRFDEKARERSLGTCRLMGEILMRDQLLNTMNDIVNTFMMTSDAHSLECLCVLLTIIGPKLKKIIVAPSRVYEQLERYSVTGYARNCRLPQRTVDMIETVLNLRQCCSTSWDSWQSYFAERKAVEDSHRRLQQRSEYQHANREPGRGILRCSQNPPSNTATHTQHRRKSVTFNPVVSILSFRRDQ